MKNLMAIRGRAASNTSALQFYLLIKEFLEKPEFCKSLSIDYQLYGAEKSNHTSTDLSWQYIHVATNFFFLTKVFIEFSQSYKQNSTSKSTQKSYKRVTIFKLGMFLVTFILITTLLVLGSEHLLARQQTHHHRLSCTGAKICFW